MRKLSLTLSSLVLAVAFLALHPSTSQAAGHVNVSLTTAGYQFTPIIGSLIKPGGGTASLPPQVFAAAVTVTNNSGETIPWTLFSGVTFAFTVYDVNGNQVWTSVPAVLPQFVMRETLKSDQSLHNSVSVPLIIQGKPLRPGMYTLEASLFGANPIFSATTTFVVKNVIVVN